MKKVLFFLLAFISVPAFAEVEEHALFDFTAPQSLDYSPALTSYDGSFDDVLRITNKVLTCKDIQISFTKGIGVGGVVIPKYFVEVDGVKDYYYTLEMRSGATITFKAAAGCNIVSVIFTGSTGTLSDCSTGVYNAASKKWTATTATDNVQINNGARDTGIQTIEVIYKKPSKPLSFISSTPSSGSEVETFRSMTLNFNLAVNSSNYNANGITLSGPGIQTPVAMTPTVNGSSVTLTAGTTYTAYGNYTVNVPAGAFKNSEGGSHETLSIPFKVNPKRDILNFVSADPAEGKYNQLPESIVLTYNEFVSVPDNATVSVCKDGVKQFVAQVALNKENTKSVIVSHARGVITDEGSWTFEFPTQTIYNGMMGDEAAERWNPSFTLAYTVETAERQEMALVKQLKSLTDNASANKAYGYPLASSAGYTALTNVIKKGEQATSEELTEAISMYYNETNVRKPENGKWFRIANVNADGSKTYLSYSDQKISLKSSYTSADAYLAIVNNGNIEFKTKDEHYLTVLGNPTGYDGFVYHQSGKPTQLNIAKLAVEGVDASKLLGLFSISGWLGRDANDEDLGNSTAAIRYPSYTIVESPTDVTYFSGSTSSAFIFEETTEPDDPNNSVEAIITFENNLKGIEVEKVGDPITLVVHNVASAEIKDASKPYFEKQNQIGAPEKVTVTSTILSKIANSAYTFSVNTTGLEAGEYILYVPAETFSYLAPSNYASVVGTSAELSITIKGNAGDNNDDQGNTGGEDDPNDPGSIGGGNESDATETKSNFSYTYPFTVNVKMLMNPDVHADVAADTWLNDIVFYSTASSIIPNPDAVIKITNINGALVKTGHLTTYSNYKKEMPYGWLQGTIALKLALDIPFQKDELKFKSGLYFVSVPREALGDTNFGKWLKDNKFTGNCIVNEATSFSFQVNNSIVDILGIEELQSEDSTEQAVYDLSGRRVDGPATKGVYIVNGRKVVIK